MSVNPYAFEVRQLYRHCLRTAFRIPDAGAKIYYRNHVNSHFVQHLSENDPQRIEALLRRGYHDVNWISRKYKLTAYRVPQSKFNDVEKGADNRARS